MCPIVENPILNLHESSTNVLEPAYKMCYKCLSKKPLSFKIAFFKFQLNFYYALSSTVFPNILKKETRNFKVDTKCGLERFYSEVVKKKVWGRKSINHGAIILLWKSWQMLQKSVETWWKKTEGKKTKSFSQCNEDKSRWMKLKKLWYRSMIFYSM